MKIQVTEEDIKNGKPRDNEHCMVALALKRAFNTEYASVGTVGASVFRFNDPKRVWAVLPQEVREYINVFDNVGYVKPFEFEFTPAE